MIFTTPSMHVHKRLTGLFFCFAVATRVSACFADTQFSNMKQWSFVTKCSIDCWIVSSQCSYSSQFSRFSCNKLSISNWQFANCYSFIHKFMRYLNGQNGSLFHSPDRFLQQGNNPLTGALCRLIRCLGVTYNEGWFPQNVPNSSAAWLGKCRNDASPSCIIH